MTKTLKKYYSAFRSALQNAIAYRGELILWTIIDTIPLLGMIVIWLAVIPPGESLKNFSQQTIISYYVYGHLIRQATGSHFENHLIKEINSGQFSKYLLKPVKLKPYFYFGEIPWRLTGLLLSVLPVTLIVWVINPQVFASLTPTKLLILPLFIILSYTLETIYSLFITATGFVFENARSFMHLRWIIATLFSGMMIPFDLLPEWLARIANFLPLRYRFYTPVNFLMSHTNLSQAFWQLVIGTAWIIILSLLLNWFWGTCLKKYTSAGN